MWEHSIRALELVAATATSPANDPQHPEASDASELRERLDRGEGTLKEHGATLGRIETKLNYTPDAHHRR